MTGGLSRRDRLAVGTAGLTRAASGGMLGTALAVVVGRQGSPLALGALSAAFFASSIVFAPLWGALGDLTGRRRALLLSLSGLATLTVLGFAAVSGVWPLVGIRAVYAAFVVGFGPLMLSLAGALSGPGRRGRTAGFYNSAAAAGDTGAQVLVGVLLGLLAPSRLFLVVAGVSLAATAAVALLRDPDRGQGSGGEPGPSSTRIDADASMQSVLRDARRRLLPTPEERRRLRSTGLTWLYVALALRHTAVKGVGSLAPFYLVSTVGVSEAVMGLLLAVGSAAQVGLMTVFGRAADAGVDDRKRLLVAGMAISGGYGLGLAAAPSLAGVTRVGVSGAAVLAVAVGFSAIDVGAIAVIGDAVPASREAAFIGLRSTAAGVGGVVGPPIVGIVATVSSFRVAFVVISVLAVLAAVLIGLTLPAGLGTGTVDPDERRAELTPGITGATRSPGESRVAADD